MSPQVLSHPAASSSFLWQGGWLLFSIFKAVFHDHLCCNCDSHNFTCVTANTLAYFILCYIVLLPILYFILYIVLCCIMLYCVTANTIFYIIYCVMLLILYFINHYPLPFIIVKLSSQIQHYD